MADEPEEKEWGAQVRFPKRKEEPASRDKPPAPKLNRQQRRAAWRTAHKSAQ